MEASLFLIKNKTSERHFKGDRADGGYRGDFIEP
jgi:hypothetical protein